MTSRDAALRRWRRPRTGREGRRPGAMGEPIMEDSTRLLAGRYLRWSFQAIATMDVASG